MIFIGLNLVDFYDLAVVLYLYYLENDAVCSNIKERLLSLDEVVSLLSVLSPYVPTHVKIKKSM